MPLPTQHAWPLARLPPAPQPAPVPTALALEAEAPVPSSLCVLAPASLEGGCQLGHTRPSPLRILRDLASTVSPSCLRAPALQPYPCPAEPGRAAPGMEVAFFHGPPEGTRSPRIPLPSRTWALRGLLAKHSSGVTEVAGPCWGLLCSGGTGCQLARSLPSRCCVFRQPAGSGASKSSVLNADTLRGRAGRDKPSTRPPSLRAPRGRPVLGHPGHCCLSGRSQPCVYPLSAGGCPCPALQPSTRRVGRPSNHGLCVWGRPGVSGPQAPACGKSSRDSASAPFCGLGHVTSSPWPRTPGFQSESWHPHRAPEMGLDWKHWFQIYCPPDRPQAAPTQARGLLPPSPTPGCTPPSRLQAPGLCPASQDGSCCLVWPLLRCSRSGRGHN